MMIIEDMKNIGSNLLDQSITGGASLPGNVDSDLATF